MDEVAQRLSADGPKRILALDGGGVRGALTVEYLAAIEKVLARRTPSPDTFRLADYFDLIGGTSTGAIIAALLARGDDVASIRQLYADLAHDVFAKRWWRKGLLAPRYESRRLQKILEAELGSITMGSPELRTGLVIVTKRLDTSSTWPITNIPTGRYFAGRTESNTVPNRDFSLAQVVRASTAAPSYFGPERIRLAPTVEGTFVDGGVSTANNPALLLLLIATLKGFTLDWATGGDQLLLTSVGTGTSPDEINMKTRLMRPAGLHAIRSMLSIMGDANALNLTLLQALSSSPTARQIDREIGDLADDHLADRPLLHYLRYNVELDSTWLHEHIGYAIDQEAATRLRSMDNATGVPLLADIGSHAAARQVRDDHFPDGFDRR